MIFCPEMVLDHKKFLSNSRVSFNKLVQKSVSDAQNWCKILDVSYDFSIKIMEICTQPLPYPTLPYTCGPGKHSFMVLRITYNKKISCK